MTYRIALPVLALILAGACSGKDATAPSGKLAPAAANADRESARSGDLIAVKNCEGYTGLAGQSCTLTSTNLKQIPAGTKVVYASGLGAGVLESDITLYPPGENGSGVPSYAQRAIASRVPAFGASSMITWPRVVAGRFASTGVSPSIRTNALASSTRP